jgi:hypothetical protein
MRTARGQRLRRLDFATGGGRASQLQQDLGSIVAGRDVLRSLLDSRPQAALRFAKVAPGVSEIGEPESRQWLLRPLAHGGLVGAIRRVETSHSSGSAGSSPGCSATIAQRPARSQVVTNRATLTSCRGSRPDLSSSRSAVAS